MNNGIKWNLEYVGAGKVRVTVDTLSKLPTIEDYKNYIGKLLKEGKLNNNRKLLDETNSAFIGDNLLLSQELLKIDCEEVAFSTPDGEMIVNAENFDEIFNSLKDKKENKKAVVNNLESIGHAIEELFERG